MNGYLSCYRAGLILGVITVVLSLTACAPVLQGGLPSWVRQPLPDSQDVIYGVGHGNNLEVAKTAGLVDIAAKLNTLISNETLVAYEQQGFSPVKQRFSSETVATVESTSLSHYQLQQSVEHGGEVWVLLALSRPDFIQQKRLELSDLDRQLQALVGRFERLSALQRLPIYSDIESLLASTRSHLMLLRAVGGVDTQAYSQRYGAYQSAIDAGRDQLSFNVVADEGGVGIAQQLVELINKVGFRAQLGEQDTGAATLKITTSIVDDGVTQGDSNQPSSLKLTAQLESLDVAGKVVASRQYLSLGRSYQSYEQALQRASVNLAARLKQQGVMQSLGLEQP